MPSHPLADRSRRSFQHWLVIGLVVHALVLLRPTVADAQIAASPASSTSSLYQPNNTIILACDVEDGSYTTIQKIHTTIQPQEKFILEHGEWAGREPDWEGTAEHLQTTYVGGWSIEVHYDDSAVTRMGRWKHSAVTNNEYGVLFGKHVPSGLTMPIEYATRTEKGCMLSRKFDPDPATKNDPNVDWHSKDWDFVESRTTQILKDKGFSKPWSKYKRSELVGAIANWIKDARLTGASVEETLHPVEFLDVGHCYCGGAANTLVAACSMLRIPARYFGTSDHAFVEFQDEERDWRYVENQPDTFMTLKSRTRNPFDLFSQREQSQRWAKSQSFDAVFKGGLIDLMADPAKYQLSDMPHLGWYYNWSCPATYKTDGSDSGTDLVARPQVIHDWVFNLYTGYGNYEGEYIHKRGFFMAERMGSVYELAALYHPRSKDLPYICRKRENDDNVVFLMPWRDSYFNEWNNPTKVLAGSGHGVRKQFYLSELTGVTRVVAAIILGPDDKVDSTIPQDGGNWYYKINGKRYHLAKHGGFKPTKNYQQTGMTVHQFEIPIAILRMAANLQTNPKGDE